MRGVLARAVGVTVALVLVAAACGDDDDAGDSSQGATTTAAAATTAGSSGTTAAPATTAASSGEPEVDKVVFSGVSPNAGNWAIQVGVEEGIFEEYGMPTEMIFSATSPAALTALIADSVQFTSTLYDAGIQAFLQEPDVIYVAAGYDLFPQELWVPNSVNSIDDLRGKVCGSTNPPGTGDHLYTQMMINDLSNGTMKLGEDYTIVQIGAAAPAIAAAFDAGQIQCRVTLPPVTGLLESLGDYKMLASAEGLPSFEDYPFFGINAKRSWVEENPNATQAFLRGYLASIAWLYDPANKDRAIEILATNAGLDTDAAAASYSWVEKGGFPRTGMMDEDWIRNTVKIQQQFGSLVALQRDIAPEILDNTFVEAAYESLPDEVKNGPGPG